MSFYGRNIVSIRDLSMDEIRFILEKTKQVKQEQTGPVLTRKQAAERFAGRELKHGTLALIEKGSPTIIITTPDQSSITFYSEQYFLNSSRKPSRKPVKYDWC